MDTCLRCEGCGADQIAYNSCRNRHCPKCQSSAAKRWLEARQADLLPVEYYHVVFTLPAPIADIAYQNKAVIYGLLFDVAAETLLTIAADPKHLGARIGATLVLHTWGSALTHHPHVHGIVPGGGLSPDGKRWVACRPGFFLPVRVLSRLFRRRFLEELAQAHQRGQLQFFGEHAALADASAFAALARAAAQVRVGGLRQAPVRRTAGRAGLPVALHAPGGDLQQPAARHGRARRHLPLEGLPGQGQQTRHKTMTLAPEEFMRRFLLHVLPGGFHRIRHYGLLANGSRKANLALARTAAGSASATHRRHRGRRQRHRRATSPASSAAHCGARDDHRADLHARAVDSRAARSSVCAMTAHAIHCSNRSLTRCSLVSACTAALCRGQVAPAPWTTQPPSKRAASLKDAIAAR